MTPATVGSLAWAEARFDRIKADMDAHDKKDEDRYDGIMSKLGSMEGPLSLDVRLDRLEQQGRERSEGIDRVRNMIWGVVGLIVFGIVAAFLRLPK